MNGPWPACRFRGSLRSWPASARRRCSFSPFLCVRRTQQAPARQCQSFPRIALKVSRIRPRGTGTLSIQRFQNFSAKYRPPEGSSSSVQAPNRPNIDPGMSCKQLLAPALLWIAVLPCPFAAAQQPGGPAAAPAAQKQSDLIAKYCFTCHNDKLKTGGLTLENRDLSKLSGDADVWEKVVRTLRGGMMPPVGMPRPDPASTDALVSYLTASLDRAAAAHPDPGPALLRRLNRSEYANAIRDLLKLDVDVSSLLPADDSSYGFDNIADVLRTSPL